MFECRVKKNIFPEEGEIVIGKILSISEDVVTMELLEYGNAKGLILSGELSKKKIKSIGQLTKVGNVEVCQVLKVEKDRGFIDLSLKRVSEDEKKLCKENFAKTKIAYQIVSKACKAAGSSISDVYENWVYKKEEEYGSLFSFFSHCKSNPELLDNEPNGESYRKTIDDQFKASSFKVRAEIDVSCAFGGIKSIKDAFGKALEYDNTLEVTLLKSPTYSVLKIGDDKEETINIVNTACLIVKEAIEELGGVYSVVTEAKVYGEKSRHTLLDNDKQNEEEGSNSGDSDDE